MSLFIAALVVWFWEWYRPEHFESEGELAILTLVLAIYFEVGYLMKLAENKK